VHIQKALIDFDCIFAIVVKDKFACCKDKL